MPGASVIWQVLHFAAPIPAIIAVWWLIGRTDAIVRRLFPDLEWEKNLGWLNIRAERRAKTALRWTGYAVYLLLAVALYGIVWAAEGLRAAGNNLWDPGVMGELALRVPVLFFCLIVWLFYLGCGLVPKLRREREKKELEGLKRFRAEAEEAEKERAMHSPSRVKSPLLKPRANAGLESLAPDRERKRR